MGLPARAARRGCDRDVIQRVRRDEGASRPPHPRHRRLGASLLTLLPALAERGVEPVLLGLEIPTWSADRFYDALRVPFVRIRSPRDIDPLLLARLVRELRADVVHTHLVHADVYGARRREPRGSARRHEAQRRPVPARAVPLRRARAHAPRREGDRDHRRRSRGSTVEQVGLPAVKVESIHYGLDELPAAVGREPAGRRAGRTRACCSPSHASSAQKGIDVAMRALPRSGPATDRPCSSCSARAPSAELEQLARELGVERRVHLLGRVPDVAAWLRRADALVHPARWEGFGLALLEAMLAALPVVATNVSSLPEIVVDGETGLARAARRPRGPGAAVTRRRSTSPAARRRRARARASASSRSHAWPTGRALYERFALAG